MAKDLVVVVGGASGIGAAAASAISATGDRVVIVDKTVNPAGANKSTAFWPQPVDITQPEQVEAAAQAIGRDVGAVSGLVNAAGILGKMHNAERVKLENWDREFDVDLRGTFIVARAFARAMLLRKRGSIVNIASIAGMASAPAHAYAAAKAGVIQLTATLAADWGPHGIRVNAVSPGFTRTPALEAGMASGALNEDLMTRHAALGRLVEPAEVAAAIAFLIGPQSSGITGINLAVDAGLLSGLPWDSYGLPRNEKPK
jgi:NAD(P)-dependent dehydrogenase (short-subunit alcohol dehydrogenase family)